MTFTAKLICALIAGLIIFGLALVDWNKTDGPAYDPGIEIDGPAYDPGISVDIDRSKPRQPLHNKPRPTTPKVKTRR